MRNLLIRACSLAATTFALASAQGCGSGSDPGSSSGSSSSSSGQPCVGFGCNDADGGTSGCVGLECNQAKCEGATKTTLTGKVFDPAGRVPLYNVVVYVPNGTPEPIISGLGPKCDTCSGSVTGSPIALTTTDASGSFTLENVPADVEFPLVVQIGKWRRTITIPKVAPCTSVALDAGTVRLPRNRNEGNIPRIALATGAADPLECLLRKIGLEDSEFGTAGSEARVHLYAGGGTPSLPTSATSSFQAGGAFASAPTLWGSLDELKKYDMVLLSCEGSENPSTKPEPARQALYDYAALGGRLFTSHYHHYWFSNSPVASVKALADWTNDYTCTDPSCPREPEPNPATIVFGTINTSFAKGAAMKEWLRNTSSLTGPGETLPIQEGRHNVNAVNADAISWITMENPAASGKVAHEYISFNTPVGAPDEQVCGRVVFTDLHVGAGDATGKPFPQGCTTPELTPQQKALEFMLFDLSSCIQRDDKPPVLPK
jgi:hypothetical protein